MRKRHASILLSISLAVFIFMMVGTTNISNANLASHTQDFVMPDPAIYINCTYNEEVLDTADEEPDVDVYSIVTICYKVPHSEFHWNNDTFLRLKGNDGAGILDVNMNHGPFFTFVSEDATHSFYRINYNVTNIGTTIFYAIYNVNTPCGQYLDSAETERHTIITFPDAPAASTPSFELIFLPLVAVVLYLQRKKQ